MGFTIRSSDDVAQTRRRIRGLLRPWFDLKPGPRGFVIGRLACIWTGIGAHHQPECVALIRRDGWTGTRIVGATFAIPAMLAVLLAPALGAVWAAKGILDGSLYAMGAVPILFLCLGALACAFWLMGRSDPERNPVVRALRHEFEPQSRRGPLKLAMPEDRIVPITMDVSGLRSLAPVAVSDLTGVLDAIETGEESHVILSRSEYEFMQCAPSEFGYTIELRASGDDWPKIARRVGDSRDATFQIDEAKQVLAAYLLGAERIPGLEWQ